MDGHQPRSSLTLATFNVHMGVDGWGRPFDVVGACGALGADMLVMQESWAPDDGSPSTADVVAGALGFQLVEEVGLAHGRLYAPIPTTAERWAPHLGHLRKTLRLDDERLQSTAGAANRTCVTGTWGVAVLSKLPVSGIEVTHLGKLRRDAARRAVIRCTVPLGGGGFTVLGTHMSHITHGSHAQYRLLSKQLPPVDSAAALAGDMNLWGPPTSSYFRGWRRAVTGRSWPAQRPHSQLDHVLITPAVSVDAARIGSYAGSDHRPAVVTLRHT